MTLAYPDVIGPLQDKETAAAAISAASMSHVRRRLRQLADAPDTATEEEEEEEAKLGVDAEAEAEAEGGAEGEVEDVEGEAGAEGAGEALNEVSFSILLWLVIVIISCGTSCKTTRLSRSVINIACSSPSSANGCISLNLVSFQHICIPWYIP